MGQKDFPGFGRPVVSFDSGATCGADRLHGRRQHILAELPGNMHCSIVGTCLTCDDLTAAARKFAIEWPADVRDYQIHSFFVRESAKPGRISKHLNKIMNERYRGGIRQVLACETPHELEQLWVRFRDSGRIACGYWAMVSCTHVPDTLIADIFGEVHMLSHSMGQGARQLAHENAELGRRCTELIERLRRSEAGKQAGMKQISALQEKVDLLLRRSSEERTLVPTDVRIRTVDRTIKRLRDKLTKQQRAIANARHRARAAELQYENAAAVISSLTAESRRFLARPTVQLDRSDSPDGPGLRGRRVLYVGGYNRLMPMLRDCTACRKGEFMHHDGGREESMQTLDSLVQAADFVLCPIDCTSHGACTRAKELCKRLSKRFLPLPSAGLSTFERTLDNLCRDEMGG